MPTTRSGLATALRRFRTEYNEQRPHEALGDVPPARCYQPSARRYQRTPVPWTYPRDYVVGRVNTNGAIRYDRRLFFVSHALATRDVGCRHIDDRVLVVFRDTYVRELDLRTGRTLPLLLPVRPRVLTMS